MRNPLIAAVAGSLIVYANPAGARSLWLKCGAQEVRISHDRERFSLTLLGKLYQGDVQFGSAQINFEIPWFQDYSGGGIKYVYAIDRKTLAYRMEAWNRVAVSRFSDAGWVPSAMQPEVGKCLIIKMPSTAGSKI
jgi:hypothetical protein